MYREAVRRKDEEKLKSRESKLEEEVKREVSVVRGRGQKRRECS